MVTWPEVAVVVPSRSLIRYLEENLVCERGLALAGVRFHTFHSLARAILLDSGVSRAALGEDGLVERAITEDAIRAGAGGAELARLAGAPGLMRVILGTLHDLEEAMFDPDAFTPESAGEASGEISELAALIPLLVRVREERDRRELLGRAGMAREAAARAPGSRVIRGLARIHYYGAYDLTQQQIDFLAAVAEGVPVDVYFPAVTAGEGKLHPAWKFAAATLTLIRGKAGKVEWLEGPSGGAFTDRFAGVMKEGEEQIADLPPGATLWRSAGEHEEWDRVARECWRLIEEEGYAPHEIVAVARSVPGVLPVVAGAFNTAGLPFECATEVPLGSLPAGRALAGLIHALGGDFSPGWVLDAATAPWLHLSPAPVPPSTARAAARRLWEGAGPADWEILSGLDPREAPAGLLAAARKLAGFAAGIPSQDTWSGFAGGLLRIYEEVTVPDPPGAVRAALESFTAAVDRLKALDDGEPVAKSRFMTTALAAVEGAGVALYDTGAGVRVMDAMGARGIRARAVFLTGLNSGVFPRVLREDPFLKDPARRALNEVLGYKVQEKGRTGLDEERLLFHMLLAAGRERVYLSWHETDADGRPALASGFLSESFELKDAATAEPVPVGVPPALWDRFTAAAGAAAGLEEAARPADARDGLVGVSLIRPAGMRVTRFIDVASCPFRAFAADILGIDRIHRPRGPFEPEAATIGIFVHAVLERSVRELMDRWETADPDEADLVVERQSRAAFPEHFPGLAAFPAVAAALAEDWVPLLAEAVREDLLWCRERGLVPREPEEEAGFALEHAGNTVRMRARIDRADHGRGVVRLADYKSHLRRGRQAKAPRFDKAFYQIALYARSRARPEDRIALSVIHLGAGSGGVVAQHAEDELAVGFCAKAEILAGATIGVLASGNAAPFPDDAGGRSPKWRPDCAVCEFSLACRREHGPTRARLESAGAWQAVRDALAGEKQADEQEAEPGEGTDG
jgi:hypothetical protein